MARFVEVPREALFERLRGAGFVEVPARGSEVVFARCHDRDRRYEIRVYTSIARDATEARARGADAIRVVAVYRPSPIFEPETGRGVYKAERVFRAGTVEGVLDRTIERARLAYAHCNRCIAVDKQNAARRSERAA